MDNITQLAEIVKGLLTNKEAAKNLGGFSLHFYVENDDDIIPLSLNYNDDLYYSWSLCQHGRNGVEKSASFGTVAEAIEAISEIQNGEDNVLKPE
jgi:hypothetical protein